MNASPSRGSDYSSFRLRHSVRTLYRDIGSEVIIAPPDDGEFESLSGTAATVWRVLDTPRRFPELLDVLAGLYEVSKDDIAPDVRDLIDRLVRRGSIEAEALPGDGGQK